MYKILKVILKMELTEPSTFEQLKNRLLHKNPDDVYVLLEVCTLAQRLGYLEDDSYVLLKLTAEGLNFIEQERLRYIRLKLTVGLSALLCLGLVLFNL